MPKLRNSVIDSVLDHLEITRFGLAAYKVDFPERGDTLFKIIFVADPQYSLELADGKDCLWLKQSPGRHKSSDIVSHSSVDSAISAIGDWSVGVSEELMARGRKRVSVDEIIEAIDTYINEKVSEPDVKFSSVEIDELNARLSSLEEKFKELLDKSEISRPEYQQVKKAIDIASNDVGVYSKRVWYKTAMTKVLSTVKSIAVSKEGRELISAAAKKMLGLD